MIPPGWELLRRINSLRLESLRRSGSCSDAVQESVSKLNDIACGKENPMATRIRVNGPKNATVEVDEKIDETVGGDTLKSENSWTGVPEAASNEGSPVEGGSARDLDWVSLLAD